MSETPAQLAAFVVHTMNVDKSVGLLEAFNRAAEKQGADLSTQLGCIAYILAEMELQAPTRGILVSALADLVASNVRTLALHDAAPAGVA